MQRALHGTNLAQTTTVHLMNRGVEHRSQGRLFMVPGMSIVAAGACGACAAWRTRRGAAWRRSAACARPCAPRSRASITEDHKVHLQSERIPCCIPCSRSRLVPCPLHRCHLLLAPCLRVTALFRRQAKALPCVLCHWICHQCVNAIWCDLDVQAHGDDDAARAQPEPGTGRVLWRQAPAAGRAPH